jgi:ParB-like chromosome segregation protein Spo0J
VIRLLPGTYLRYLTKRFLRRRIKVKVKIEEIWIGDRKREADSKKVNEIADSIKEIGLINPITVDQNYNLIAGLHRLRACETLGWIEVECNVTDLKGLKAELAEIDENLIRNEYHFTERGEHLKRRKEIYEKIYPESKPEEQRKKGLNVSGEIISSLEETKTFVQDTAEKTGVSERTIQQEIQIATNLIPEAKEVVKELDLPKTQVLKLARVEPEEQNKVVEIIEKHPEIKELPKKDILETAQKIEVLPEPVLLEVVKEIKETKKVPQVIKELSPKEKANRDPEYRIYDAFHEFSILLNGVTRYGGFETIINSIPHDDLKVLGKELLDIKGKIDLWFSMTQDKIKQESNLRRVK